MAICPRCQADISDGTLLCQTCGGSEISCTRSDTPAPLVVESRSTWDARTAIDVGSALAGRSGEATLADEPRPSTDDLSEPNPSPPESGSLPVTPLLGAVEPCTVTVCTRMPAASRPLEVSPPSARSAISVLESGVTKVSPRAIGPSIAGGSLAARPANPEPTPPAVAAKTDDKKPVEVKLGTPKLIVLRGERMNAVYPIYEGPNVIGRFADKPVDIDLEDQEILERIRVSRRHAIIHFEKGVLAIEDLNSLNFTWVNGTKVFGGMQRRLAANDIIQIGTVQMRLLIDPPE